MSYLASGGVPETTLDWFTCSPAAALSTGGLRVTSAPVAMSVITAEPPVGVGGLHATFESLPFDEGITTVMNETVEPDASSVTAGFAPDLDAAEDERLIRCAQQGDLDAFNQLVARHERIVFSVSLRILRDVTAAEDATQDTFLKAWTSIHTFRGGMVRPWLLRIATNRSYDAIRAQNRRPADSLDAELYEVEPSWSSQVGAGEDPEGFAARVELSGYLEKALGQLPEDQRTVVVLSDIHGYGYEEIAEILEVAIGTVKSRISRGRARLRQALSEDPSNREHFGALQRSLVN